MFLQFSNWDLSFNLAINLRIWILRILPCTSNKDLTLCLSFLRPCDMMPQNWMYGMYYLTMGMQYLNMWTYLIFYSGYFFIYFINNNFMWRHNIVRKSLSHFVKTFFFHLLLAPPLLITLSASTRTTMVPQRHFMTTVRWGEGTNHEGK